MEWTGSSTYPAGSRVEVRSSASDYPVRITELRRVVSSVVATEVTIIHVRDGRRDPPAPSDLR